MYQPHLYGLIFLFKIPTERSSGAAGGARRRTRGDLDEEAAERLFFARQTIQNACGTQALLSIVLNKCQPPSPHHNLLPETIDVGPRLREFREFAMALPPEMRGDALSNCELIRDVHNSFARASPFADETARHASAQDDDAEDLFHFVAYTQIDDVLYELDGLRTAPLNHGSCTQAEFPTKVMDIIAERIQEYGDSEIRFSLLAVVRDPRVSAREMGDAHTVEMENRKRTVWQWENALRRHNFVGFAGELMKHVVKQKDQEGKYDEWLDQGKVRFERRLRLTRMQRSGNHDAEMTG